MQNRLLSYALIALIFSGCGTAEVNGGNNPYTNPPTVKKPGSSAACIASPSDPKACIGLNEHCVNGTCTQCPTSLVHCGTACSCDTTTSACVAGQCVPKSSTQQCTGDPSDPTVCPGENQHCVAGQCVDCDASMIHCGSEACSCNSQTHTCSASGTCDPKPVSACGEAFAPCTGSTDEYCDGTQCVSCPNSLINCGDKACACNSNTQVCSASGTCEPKPASSKCSGSYTPCTGTTSEYCDGSECVTCPLSYINCGSDACACDPQTQTCDAASGKCVPKGGCASCTDPASFCSGTQCVQCPADSFGDPTFNCDGDNSNGCECQGYKATCTNYGGCSVGV